MPINPAARERLRLAQAQEAEAAAGALAALVDLDRQRESVAEQIEAATATIDRKEQDLRAAQATLVHVSGLDRAATLLDVSKGELRRAVASTRRSGREGAQAQKNEQP